MKLLFLNILIFFCLNIKAQQNFCNGFPTPQILSGSGTNTISLSGSPNFVIPTQTTVLTANNVTTALGYIPISNTYTPIDNSITNEIQTLNGTNTNTFTLSNGGGSVIIPTHTFTALNGLTITAVTNSYTITQKRQQTLTSITNTSGLATFTWSAYTTTPNIQATLSFAAGNKETIIFNSAPTITGVVFLVQLRADVLGLLPSYSNVNAREVKIIVTEE